MFFGILIRMFYNDHNPPHFHAEYQGQKGMFSMSGDLIEGHFPSKKAKQLIKEWALLHTSELEENWKNAINHAQLDLPPIYVPV